ncbi:hypothetical protein [Mangrovimonas spongiae]|uniref:Uncharacterized protein n=1 Tax=Mangrovimonas spongiae TaxID=2494697 RepID=A0A428K4V8_9FLAO|nr:hypothetical protein [Mangrovimonas spongiae]RSK41402.1 hypothetical protein EJA19_00580 [Mangrovimonas spongiae]
MESKDNTFMDKVIDSLKNTTVKLEELQVKAALGKAEAQDLFEDTKKQFNRFIHDSEIKTNNVKKNIDNLHADFDELRVQLALGKAETKDLFKAQKKQILSKLHNIEVKIKTNESLNKMYALTLIEIEQFKIELDILEEKFNKSKYEIKETFQREKQDFNAFINKFKEKYSKKEETKLEHFQNEISEAFTHFKKAFSKA